MSRRPVVATLDDESIDHVREALRMYLVWTQRGGQRVPDQVHQWHAALRDDVRRRQQAPLLEAPVTSLDGGALPPWAYTYEAAGHLLSLSARQIQRLVADGALPVVHIRGSARIRATDLRAYLDTLTDQEPTPC